MSVVRRPCKGPCGKNRAEKFFASPRARICSACHRRSRQRNSRSQRLREVYGITLDEYEALLEWQGGACAVCGRRPKYNLDIDHNHETGQIRGLLCKLCNRHLLPAAREDTGTLAVAIHYLNHPPAKAVIGERRVVR